MAHDTTGGLYEARLLGQISSKNSKYYRTLSMTKGRGQQIMPHKNRPDAMKEIKQMQPWEDIREYDSPDGKDLYFPKELLIAIEDGLGIDPEDPNFELKYYTAVADDRLKTHLDIYHGVDAFVEYKDKTGTIRVVTIDATLNTRKAREGAKADFIVTPEEEDDERLRGIDGNVVYLPDPGAKNAKGEIEINDEFLEIIERLGVMIAKRLGDPHEPGRETLPLLR
ncbi:hypothetical protein HQ571_02130 [Candidatus Kuenenbacteria bacterium]|nr:hypothetical protein [Candidatus Kuenenbacteria bacterium]